MGDREKYYIAIAWIGAFGNFLTSHISTIISVTCGAAALIASVYSIIVSRKKIELLNQEIKEGHLRVEMENDDYEGD